MRKIKLTRNKYALVDDQDFDWLNQWKWFCEEHGYASRDVWRNGKSKRIKMHRLIMGTPDGMEIDHIDGDGLNNQRNNLRLATRAQNQKNLKRPITNTSGYKGVSWDNARKKWVAYIWSGKSINLGGFHSKTEAARAYDEAARNLHGEFARLNHV